MRCTISFKICYYYYYFFACKFLEASTAPVVLIMLHPYIMCMLITSWYPLLLYVVLQTISYMILCMNGFLYKFYSEYNQYWYTHIHTKNICVTICPLIEFLTFTWGGNNSINYRTWRRYSGSCYFLIYLTINKEKPHDIHHVDSIDHFLQPPWREEITEKML